MSNKTESSAQAGKGGRPSDAGGADEAADVIQLEVTGCAKLCRPRACHAVCALKRRVAYAIQRIWYSTKRRQRG